MRESVKKVDWNERRIGLPARGEAPRGSVLVSNSQRYLGVLCASAVSFSYHFTAESQSTQRLRREKLQIGEDPRSAVDYESEFQ